MKKVYLAGQFSEYDGWKEKIKKISGFDFYDPEIDSDQSSPDAFYPDDLEAVKNSDILVANPGIAPSEGTWVEIGYFIANNTNRPGDFCENLIIIWSKGRTDWSREFINKTGKIVSSTEEAKFELEKIRG